MKHFTLNKYLTKVILYSREKVKCYPVAKLNQSCQFEAMKIILSPKYTQFFILRLKIILFTISSFLYKNNQQPHFYLLYSNGIKSIICIYIIFDYKFNTTNYKI